MMNPNQIKPILKDLVELFEHDKMFKFAHIPIQSGSDSVLDDMQRGYSVLEFEEIIRYFVSKVPGITIATDIIVGYPTESEKDFEKTLELVNKIKPSIINFAKFRKRPGTYADKYKTLPTPIVQKRSGMLSSAFDWIAFENKKKLKGSNQRILVESVGKDDTLIARTDSYVQVIISNDGTIKPGDVKSVLIKDFTKHYLIV